MATVPQPDPTQPPIVDPTHPTPEIFPPDPPPPRPDEMPPIGPPIDPPGPPPIRAATRS